jgi:magnesium-transporting ATPase (P-type)
MIHITLLIFTTSSTSYIVSGSVILSDNVIIWTTACGKDKKSYMNHKELRITTSNLDRHIANYMIKVNAVVLGILIILVSSIKLYTLQDIISGNVIYNFIFFSVQNWIIFNGIIPFSVKIMLILSRNIQSSQISKCTNNNITVNNSSLIDNICTIDKIVSDKTGTLTKNKLHLTLLVDGINKNIIDVKNYNNESINTEFMKHLGICIHVQNDIYSTSEDEAIRTRYPYLNCHVIQKGNTINIYTNNNEEYYLEYIDIAGLDFTYNRKMSSKIVRDSNNRLYLYSKGSLDVFNKRLINKDIPKLNEIDNIISNHDPSLRVLACGYRELHESELSNLLNDSLNNSIHIKELESDLHFLGVIGIRDNLQDGIISTITKLQHYGIPISMLTGDRKITATHIGKQCNIIDDINNIIDTEIDSINSDCTDKTLIINGSTFDRYKDNTKFINNLRQCKNFIAYNLIPEHKSNIVKLLNCNTLSIGDGFNDIGMFNESNISVAIKGNNHVEESSDYTVKTFKDLDLLITKIGIDYYNKNTLLINFIFYRCITVITCLILNCLINYDKITDSVLNGFVLKGFNFAWAIFHIGYHLLTPTYYNKNYTSQDYKNAKQEIKSNYIHTTIWNLNGLLTGLLITYYTYISFSSLPYYSDILGFIIVTLLNCKLLFHNCYNINHILFSLIGIGLFILYMFYNGTIYQVLSTLFNNTSIYYWKNIITYFIILNLTIR